MVAIRPQDLAAVNDGIVNPDAAIIADVGYGVRRATPAQVADAGAPVSSQAEAEAGVVNTGRMTALRVKQAIEAIGVSQAALASPTGAAMVGTTSGGTVQSDLDALDGLEPPIGLIPTYTVVFGSYLRSEVKLPNGGGIIVSGAGSIPVIDGADIVTGWTAHPSEANVWQKIGWTHDATSSHRLTVYQDDLLMDRVVDAAACSATPGSFVDIKGSDGTPLTINIHATGSGNPNSNGKLYEATKRDTVIEAMGGFSIQGPIITRRAIDNDGSLVVFGQFGASQVLARDGTKHNIGLFGPGSIRDSIAFSADPPTSYEGSNTFYVSYMDDPTGSSVLYERCGATQPPGVGTAFSGNVAFFAHGASPGLVFSSITIRQCWAQGLVFGGHSTGAATGLEEGCYWNCLSAVSTAEVYTARYGMANLPRVIEGVAASANTLGGQTFNDNAFFFGSRNSTDNDSFRTISGTSTFTRCALVMGGPYNFNAAAFGSILSSGGIVVNDSFIGGFSGNLLSVPTGSSYVGNNNVFWYANQFALAQGFQASRNGASITTLSAWQAATSQDGNSVYALETDQQAANAGAFFLAWKDATGGTDISTIGPAVGDFRVNPAAKVYKADGTPLTGTLADGTTPITSVGPNGHWNWTTRAAVSGPPTEWPTIPEDLSECEAYITSPSGWDWSA